MYPDIRGRGGGGISERFPHKSHTEEGDCQVPIYQSVSYDENENWNARLTERPTPRGRRFTRNCCARMFPCLGISAGGAPRDNRTSTRSQSHSAGVFALIFFSIALCFVLFLFLAMLIAYGMPWDVIDARDPQRKGWVAFLGDKLGILQYRMITDPPYTGPPVSSDITGLGHVLEKDNIMTLLDTSAGFQVVAKQIGEISAWLAAIKQALPLNGTTELARFLLAELLVREKGSNSTTEQQSSFLTEEIDGATTGHADRGENRDQGQHQKRREEDDMGDGNRMEKEEDRLQIPGIEFVRATSHDAEMENVQPFDDFEMLKYRHALLKTGWCNSARKNANAATSSQLTSKTKDKDEDSAASTSVPIACEVNPTLADDDTLLEMRHALYVASSVLNRRLYYPIRRWEKVSPFQLFAPVSTSEAWHHALLHEAYYHLGSYQAGSPSNGAVAAVGSVAWTPFTQLSVPFLSPKRLTDFDKYATPTFRQLLPPEDYAADTRTIFVSFASFRDVQCGPTLVDMMRKAKNIYRVYVGIAEQNDYNVDPPALPEQLYEPVPCYVPHGVPRYYNRAGDAGGRGGKVTHETQVAVVGEADDAITSSARRVFTSLTPQHEEQLEASQYMKSVCYFHENIRIRRVRSSTALGPTYGRYVAMLLYRGESMTMVIDSHNRFIPHWDSLGVHLFHKYDDPKTALSHYPASYHDGPEDEEGTVTKQGLPPFDFFRTSSAYLCKATFPGDFGYVRLGGIICGGTAEFTKNNVFNDPYVALQSKDIPERTNFRLPQPWVAGGFLFTNASIYREVPFDPHLPYIFDGEEVLYSVRLWTHGYNIYSPERNLAYHFYGRPTAPKVWNQAPLWDPIQRQSRRRIHFMLRARFKGSDQLRVPQSVSSPIVVVDIDRYGLGKERTIEQWYSYAGVDPVKYLVEGKWCGV